MIEKEACSGTLLFFDKLYFFRKYLSGYWKFHKAGTHSWFVMESPQNLEYNQAGLF